MDHKKTKKRKISIAPTKRKNKKNNPPRKSTHPKKELAQRQKSQRIISMQPIETPPCGFNWDDKGRSDLSDEIKTKQGITKSFYPNRKSTTDDDKNKVEENIFSAKVTVLQSEEEGYPVYGMFANAHITLNKYSQLGEYQGVVSKITSKSHDEKESTYSFNLGNGYELRAEEGGSWPQLINSALSPETANVYYNLGADKKSIVCYLKKDIFPGQQIIGYYTEGYPYDEENMRFLHPIDNWQSSKEYYESHEHLYRLTENYAFPKIELLNHTNINLPLLRRNNGKFLTQFEQEKMTLLHYACKSGNLSLLESVIKKSPDVNIQMRISGDSALHLLFLNNNLTTREKITFAEIILSVSNFIPLTLQNREKKTVLHLAIEQQDSVLIEYLLNVQDKKNEGTKNFEERRNKDVRYYKNNEGHDFILSALLTGSLDVIQTIKKHMRADDLRILFDEQFDDLCVIWTDLSKKHSPQQLVEIIDVLGFNKEQRTKLAPYQERNFKEEEKSLPPQEEEDESIHLLSPYLQGRVKGWDILLSLQESFREIWDLYQHSYFIDYSDLREELERAALSIGELIKSIESKNHFELKKIHYLKEPVLCFNEVDNEAFKTIHSCLINLSSLKDLQWEGLSDALSIAYDSAFSACLGFMDRILELEKQNDESTEVIDNHSHPNPIITTGAEPKFPLAPFNDFVHLYGSDDNYDFLQKIFHSSSASKIYCNSTLSISQLEYIAKHSIYDKEIIIDPSMTIGQIEALVRNLKPTAGIILSDDLNYQQLNTIASNLQRTRTVMATENMSLRKLRYFVERVNPEVFFYCHEVMPEENIEAVAESIAKGVILSFRPNTCLNNKITSNVLKRAISSLKPGVLIDLSNFGWFQDIIDVIGELKAGRGLLINSLRTSEQIRKTVLSMKPCTKLVCYGFLDDDQLNSLKQGLMNNIGVDFEPRHQTIKEYKTKLDSLLKSMHPNEELTDDNNFLMSDSDDEISDDGSADSIDSIEIIDLTDEPDYTPTTWQTKRKKRSIEALKGTLEKNEDLDKADSSERLLFKELKKRKTSEEKQSALLNFSLLGKRRKLSQNDEHKIRYNLYRRR